VRSTPPGYRVRALGLGDGSDWLIGSGRHRLGRSDQAFELVAQPHAEVPMAIQSAGEG
jgi:hypothetical protein